MRRLAYFGILGLVFFGLTACGGGGGGGSSAAIRETLGETPSLLSIDQPASVVSVDGSILLSATVDFSELGEVTDSALLVWSIVSPNVRGSEVVASVDEDGLVTGVSKGEVVVLVNYVDTGVSDNSLASATVTIVVGDALVLEDCSTDGLVDLANEWPDTLSNADGEICVSINGDLSFENIPSEDDFSVGAFKFITQVAGDLTTVATDLHGSLGFENLVSIGGRLVVASSIPAQNYALGALESVGSTIDVSAAVDGFELTVSEDVVINEGELSCDVFRVVLGFGEAQHLVCDGDSGLDNVAINIAFNALMPDVVTHDSTLSLEASVDVSGESLSLLSDLIVWRVLGPGGSVDLDVLTTSDSVRERLVVQATLLHPDDESEWLVATRDFRVGLPIVVEGCDDASDLSLGFSNNWAGITDENHQLCSTIGGDFSIDSAAASPNVWFLNHIVAVEGDLSLKNLIVPGFDADLHDPVFVNLERVMGTLNVLGEGDGASQFPSLTEVGSNLILATYELRDTDPLFPEFPVLASVGGLESKFTFFPFAAEMHELDFPSLVTVSERMRFFNTGSLVTINAPLLRFIGDGLDIQPFSDSLELVSFPSLEEVSGSFIEPIEASEVSVLFAYAYAGEVEADFSSLVTVEGQIAFASSEDFNLSIPSATVSIDGDGCFAYQQSLDGARSSLGESSNITCL